MAVALAIHPAFFLSACMVASELQYIHLQTSYCSYLLFGFVF